FGCQSRPLFAPDSTNHSALPGAGRPEMDCGEQRFNIKLERYAERRANSRCLVALFAGRSGTSLAGLGRSRAPGNASSPIAAETISERKNVIACLSCRPESRQLYR